MGRHSTYCFPFLAILACLNAYIFKLSLQLQVIPTLSYSVTTQPDHLTLWLDLNPSATCILVSIITVSFPQIDFVFTQTFPIAINRNPTQTQLVLIQLNLLAHMTGVQVSVTVQSRGSDCVFRSLSLNYLFFPVGWSLSPVLLLTEVLASVSLVLRFGSEPLWPWWF